MINSVSPFTNRILTMGNRPITAAASDSPDRVDIQANPQRKSVGQALWSAAKWGAVGGVLSAVPFFGYFASAMGGAIAGDLMASKDHKVTSMLMGGTAGIATHVIPIAGLQIAGIAVLPATVLFGAAVWGYAAYKHARGEA